MLVVVKKVNMKTQVVIKTAIFCFVFVVFVGCNETKQEKEKFFKEYTEHYTEANSPFANEDIIVSTIAYIDGIIAKEGNKNIVNIYYDKAGLLYKLKRYNEALDVLFQTDDEFYDVYKATLFICLGRNSEAASYLQNLIDRNKRGLIELAKLPDRKNIIGEKNIYIQGLITLYILADRSYESILYELTSETITTQQEAEILLQEMFLDDIQDDIQKAKRILLISMWPGMEDMR